ncbi:MAG: hypothetical protein Tsb009_20670 [Planctomycetaceae bacterium]
MRRTFVVMAALLLGSFFVGAKEATAQGRFGVAHVTNRTRGNMSFYYQLVWNYGKANARVHKNWVKRTIPPGKTLTVYYAYQNAAAKSPDLVVVFDSLRKAGAHWQKVILQKAQSPDYKDPRYGYKYELRYDNANQRYASIYPQKRGKGKVYIVDRKVSRPPRVQ